MVRLSGGRGVKARKGYICVFVCLATKAVQLEVSVDLLTKVFIAAYRRFVFRRGQCMIIRRSNGSNFKGVSVEYANMFRKSFEFYKSYAVIPANYGTSWTSISPVAPHMGNLWEAAVESTKHHLCRVVDKYKLTFNELSTLLAQIEAVLNSRPLSPISIDPADLTPLTPTFSSVSLTLRFPSHKPRRRFQFSSRYT